MYDDVQVPVHSYYIHCTCIRLCHDALHVQCVHVCVYMYMYVYACTCVHMHTV